MKSVDLEKYKSAWENERSFNEKKLTADKISRFLKSSSKSLNELFKKGILIDIVLKSALLFALIVFFFIASEPFFRNMSILVLFIVVAGMFGQKYILGKLFSYESANQNVVEKLQGYTRYYYRYYIRSIFIGALSGALFFIIGSMFYLQLKYHEIPQFQIDDIIVFSAGILLSYGFSAIVQLKYNNFRINQLLACLRDLEENTFNELTIRKYYSFRKKSVAAFGFMLIAGIIVLLIILMTIYS